MTSGLQAATGDCSIEARQEELQDLMVVCGPELRRRALALTGNASDAGDLVQDTLEHAIRALSRFQAGTNLRVWLVTIMKNLFFDMCRSAKTRRRVTGMIESQAESTSPSEEDMADVPLWARVSPEQFRAAVARLEPSSRDVFCMRVEGGLPYSEIGARLGIPISTVGTRLIRTRARLKQILLEDLGETGKGGDR